MKLSEFVKDFKMVGTAVVAFLGLVTTIWVVSDRLVTDTELQTSEDKIISEVRMESASLRSIIIEDMEARLDDLAFELAMAERRGDEPNQAMIIQRNNLDRRIQRLKEDEASDPPNNP